MKKQTFIIPLTIVVMGLTSCNKSFSRHVLKDSNETTVKQIIQGLSADGKQLKSDSGSIPSKQTALIDSEKATISAKNVYDFTYKQDNVVTRSGNRNLAVSGGVDTKNSTAKLSFKENEIERDDSESGSYVKKCNDNEDYIKIVDNDIYLAQKDNIQGYKIKNKDEMEALKSYYNLDIWSIVLGSSHNLGKQQSVNYVIDPVSFVWNTNSSNYKFAIFDLTGGISRLNVMPEDKCPDVIEYLANKFIEAEFKDKLTIKYCSNDENSFSIAIKGTVDFKDYLGSEAQYMDNINGNIDIDLFVCFEDKFLTQLDTTMIYNNVTFQPKDENDEKTVPVYSFDGKSHAEINVDYKNGSSINVNLDEFVDR